ncbi:hypothetical protein ACJX0J_005238 [Zea mays]
MEQNRRQKQEFLLLSFFLSIEEYRLLEFGLSKKPWYRILIVNFYTELQSSFAWSRNRIPFFSFLFLLKEFNWLIIEEIDEIHPIKKEIIRIRNRKNFFFFFKFNSLLSFIPKFSRKSNFIFNGGLMFRLMNRFSLFFTLLYLTLSCFLNLSFGFLFFYLESAFKTKKKRKSFSIPNKDYYSLDLGQDSLLIEINRLFQMLFYSYARDRILRDMTKISPF